MANIRFSPALKRFFDEGRALQDVYGIISNNVEYAYWIEYGTRRTRPRAMIRGHLREYRGMLDDALLHHIGQNPDNPQRAAVAGVTEATLQIQRAIADRTPVDTGRLKTGWVATLPGGRKFGDISGAAAASRARKYAGEARREREALAAKRRRKRG